MAKTYVYDLHDDGPALWPEHKPLAEVLDLRDTTPDDTFESTWQGNPSPPGGMIYRRDWWLGRNRYDPERVEELARTASARWQTWDTGVEDKDTSAYTAALTVDVLPDRRVLLRDAWRKRMTFAELPDAIEEYAERWNYDHLLSDGENSGVLIESKSSGTSAYQTLTAASKVPWLSGKLKPWIPDVDKLHRARQASVWCRNSCVLFPIPSYLVPWLLTFETELFAVPSAEYMDQADAFSQLILYLENVISAGYHARRAFARAKAQAAGATAGPAII